MTTVSVSPRVGPRTFQVRVGNTVQTRVVNPGEEVDLDLVDPEDPVLVGMADTGEILIGGGKAKGTSKVAAEAEELKSQLAEAQKKLAAIEAERDALRFKLDPNAIETRDRLEAAGRTPGLADPLPAGAEDAEGEETQQAREATGADVLEEQRERRAAALQRGAEAAGDADLGPGAPGVGTMVARETQGTPRVRPRAKPAKPKSEE